MASRDTNQSQRAETSAESDKKQDNTTGGMRGIKRSAVEQEKNMQRGSGNACMTNVAEQQTITVTYNFNF